MPKTFSFEEATKAPVASAGTPKTFSFEQAKPPTSGYDRALSEARKSAGPGTAADIMYHGLTFGFGDELDAALMGGLTGASNLVRRVTGHQIPYTAGEAYRATEQAQREQEEALKAKHPLMHFALYTAGSALNPLTKLAGAKVLSQTGMLPKIAAAAGTGAGLGALAGAGEAEGGPGKRLKGAEGGALGGAVFGGLMEPAAELGGAGIEAIGRMLRHGGNVSQTAIKAIAEAMKRDGMTPDKIDAAIKEWNATGAPPPHFVDVAGPNTRAVIRDAAVKHGIARTKVVDYLDRVQQNLRRNAEGPIWNMSPETRSATALRDHLNEARDALADTKYRAPYEKKIPITEAMVKAIADPEGRKAVQYALKEARARQDYGRVKELESLLDSSVMKLDPRLPEAVRAKIIKQAGKDTQISGGALDRIRRAFSEMGRAAYKSEKRGLGGGYAGRASQIDAELDKIPALKEARASYKAHMDQLRAMDYAQGVRVTTQGNIRGVDGTGVINARPSEFAKRIKAMTKEERGAAQVGARQAIIDAMMKGRTALPIVQRIASDEGVKENLTALLGPDAANRITAAARVEVKRVRIANWLSPELGAKTSDVRSNRPTFWEILRFWHNPAMAGLWAALQNVGMSEADRAAITDAGLAPADTTLSQLLAQPAPKTVLPAGGRERLQAAGASAAGQTTADQQ